MNVLMQDNSNQTTTQPTDSQQMGTPPVPPVTDNFPDNQLGGLVGGINSPAQDVVPDVPVSPAPVDNPVAAVDTAPISTPLDVTLEPAPAMPEVKAEEKAQMPTENLDVDVAATPVVPAATPAPEPMPEPMSEPVKPVETPSNIDASTLNVTDMMDTKPSDPENVTPVSPTAKAESLNVLSDISPTPVVEKPSEPFTPPVPAQTGPVSIAPEGQLSQVFELAPSDVEIPSSTTPSVQQSEPSMVPLDSIGNTNMSSNINSELVTKDQPKNQKSGKLGSILRYVIWTFILLLGMVAVVMGTYLAKLIDIPFLDTIFGR